MSNRQKSILTTLGATVVGGTIGYINSPPTTVPLAHAAVWAGVSGVSAGIASLFIYDSEADKRGSEKKVAELERIILGDSHESRRMVGEYSALGGNPLPQHLNMVKPGDVREYEVDRWVYDSETHGFHMDREIEIQLPVLGAEKPKRPYLDLDQNREQKKEKNL